MPDLSSKKLARLVQTNLIEVAPTRLLSNVLVNNLMTIVIVIVIMMVIVNANNIIIIISMVIILIIRTSDPSSLRQMA